jgi:hypothetical protein
MGFVGALRARAQNIPLPGGSQRRKDSYGAGFSYNGNVMRLRRMIFLPQAEISPRKILPIRMGFGTFIDVHLEIEGWFLRPAERIWICE